MSRKHRNEFEPAVIIPVNPRTQLEADRLTSFPTRRTADVECHIRHLNRNGAVIWHTRRSPPREQVRRGYFYQSGQKGVTHWFSIEEWLDYSRTHLKPEYEKYLTPERKLEYDEDTSPEFRKQYPKAKFTGILIDNIMEFDEVQPLTRFAKLSDNQPPGNVESSPLVKFIEFPDHKPEPDLDELTHKTIANYISREKVVEELFLWHLEKGDPSLIARQCVLKSGQRLDVVIKGTEVTVFEIKAPNVQAGLKELNQLKQQMKELRKNFDKVEGRIVCASVDDKLRKEIENEQRIKVITYRFHVRFD